MEGNIIKNLTNGIYNSGSHELNWDGTDNLGNSVLSGTYFYSINSENKNETKKMLIIK